MSENSTNLGLPYLQAAQAQKHLTHNEALERLDLIVQLTVQAFGATVPPLAPTEGQVWALGTGATGDWSGQDGNLAAWANGGWLFIPPRAGWRAAMGSELRVFQGGAWTMPDVPPLQNLPGVGIGTSFDGTNRLAVASAAVLFTHAGAGQQVKLNKAAAGETASLLYQTGFSGRAEMGLAGSDDWSLKVSPDGTAWTTALTTSASSGAVSLPQGLTVAGPLTLPAGGVTRAALASGSARSVIGRSGSTSGAVADISAASDHQVLRRSGTTLGFGAIALNQSAAVTGTLPLANGGTGATDAAGARSALGLGTAAPATLTTSDTDITAGRVPTVGWLGLGAASVERGQHHTALSFPTLLDADFTAGVRYLLLGRYANDAFKMSGRLIGGRAETSSAHGDHAVFDISTHKGAGGTRASSFLARHTSFVSTRRVQVRKLTHGGQEWLALELFGASTIPAFRSGIVFSGFIAGHEPLWVNQSTVSAVADPDFDVLFLEANNSALYRRANILGTVGQTGGVPTGAVIESGSNANGQFVRFADGLQICTNGNAAITTNPAAFAGTVTSVDGDKLRIGRWF